MISFLKNSRLSIHFRILMVFLENNTNYLNSDGFFRYWHRSLNPKKLIEVKFSHLSRNMTMQRTLKLYKLPDQPKTPGFRKMTAADVPKTHKLLKEVALALRSVIIPVINFSCCSTCLNFIYHRCSVKKIFDIGSCRKMALWIVLS